MLPKRREARVWIRTSDSRFLSPAAVVQALTAALLLIGFVSTEPSLALELEPMPATDLSAEEPEVRAQLEERGARLARLLEEWSPKEDLRTDEAAGVVAEAFAEMGGLHYLYGHLQVARTAFSNALQLAREIDHPRRLQWVYLLAVVRTDLGAADVALAGLDEVLSERPQDLAVLIRKAELLVNLGRFEEAEQVFLRAQKVAPNQAAVLAGLGALASQQGQHEHAIEMLQAALELQPEADSLYYALGQSLRTVGRVDEARAALRKNKQGLTRFPDPWVDALSRDNMSSLALRHEADGAMRRGEMERAGDLFQRYLLRQPEDAVATYNLGMTQLARQQRAQGLRSLRRAMELDPEFSAPHFFLASALAEDGLFDEALVHYRRAHELDPTEPDFLAEYATLLARQGRSTEALSLLAAAVEEQPRVGQLRLRYGAVLVNSGRIDEARPILQELAGAGVQSHVQAEALYHLAQLDLRAGRSVEAQGKLERARELDPGSAATNVALAQLLAGAGELDRALPLFEMASRGRPRDENAHFGRSMTLLLLERDVDAVRVLEEALEWLPGHPGLRHLLARVLATSDSAPARDGERAARMAEELVRERLTMDHAETFAMALAEVGRWDEAIVWQQRVLDRASSAGAAPATLSRLREALELYRSGRVPRDPWEIR